MGVNQDCSVSVFHPSPRLSVRYAHGPFVLNCKGPLKSRALFFVFYPSLNLYLFFTYSINIYTNFSVTENGVSL